MARTARPHRPSTSWPRPIPANPYGAALPWPRRGDDDRRPFQRAAGAYVVLVDGVAALYLERGGSTLQTLPAADDPDVAAAALRGLASLVGERTRSASSSSARSTACPSASRRGATALLEAGFVAGLPRPDVRGAR